MPSAELTVLGTDTAVLRIADRRVELSARHSELLVVLAAHPDGLAATDLAAAVYGDPRSSSPCAPRSSGSDGSSRSTRRT